MVACITVLTILFVSRRARELINNIVQTRGGPRDAGPPSVESLGGQHNVGIDLTLAPNVST